jgi:ribosomal protein L37AE/L43A
VFRDTWPEIAVIKGAQLGFSTTAIVRVFWFLTTFPSNVIYTMPSGAEVSKFTQARINPIVNGSPYLAKRIVDVNSVFVKQFMVASEEQIAARANQPKTTRFSGLRSTVYFGGSSNEKDARSVDADLLVHDEEDLADPQVIEQFESRLDHSRFKWKFRLSTPRLPGAGIDRVWQTTDKRHWFVKCSGCNARFEMAFPDGPWDYGNIEPLTFAEVEKGAVARYVCHRCGKTLTNEDRGNGIWVPEVTTRLAIPHGYQVSQMAAPWIPAERVLKRRQEATWDSDFWNLVMGIPWEESTNAITKDAIYDRCGDSPFATSGQGCTMGVDIGAKVDVVIGDRDPSGAPRTIWLGRVGGYSDLDQLMRQFNVSTCVIDELPEVHSTREWAAKWGKRVWRSVYGGGLKSNSNPVWDEKNGTVSSARTLILTESASELLNERILPSRAVMESTEAGKAYVQHHVNSKRIPVYVEGLEHDKVVDRYEWHEVGPDHMFHAATYEMLARLAPRGMYAPRRGLITTQRGRGQHGEIDDKPTRIRWG